MSSENKALVVAFLIPFLVFVMAFCAALLCRALGVLTW